MLLPSHNWSCRVIFVTAVLFSLAACASYPDDPRSPQAGDDTYTLEEDSFLNVPVDEGVLTNDLAREGAAVTLLTVGELETENGGTVDMANDGSFTYEPSDNFTGTDQLTYSIRNVKGKQSDGSVFFNVTPVNDPPEPVDDYLTTQAGESVSTNVLENDIEPDGDSMTVINVGDSDGGEIQLGTDGQLTYNPLNHTGTVQFYYEVSDGQGETEFGWVHITIEGGEIDVQPDTLEVMEEVSGTLSFTDLLANDSVAAFDAPLSVIDLGEAQNGTVVDNGNDTLTYTPIEEFSGVDTFTYTVQSRSGRTASGMVTVTVVAVEDPPTISAIDDISIDQGTATGAIEFTVGDPDTPLEDLVVSAEVDVATPSDLIPQDGIVIGSNVGETRTLRVTPDPDLSGSATIWVSVDDGNTVVSESFTLTVIPPNTLPTISAVTNQTTVANTSITVNFTVDDSETPPAQLAVSAVSSNQDLVPDDNLVFGGGGRSRSLAITPALLQTGTTDITISVTETLSSGVQTARTTFQLTVTPVVVNTEPIISDIENQTTNLNESISVEFTVADAESAVEELSVTAVSDDQNLITAANLVIEGTAAQRTLTMTPSEGQIGSANITLQVSDGDLTDETIFQLTVVGDDTTDSLPSPDTLEIHSSGTETLLLSDETVTLSASDDAYEISEDTLLTVEAANGVLINDLDSTGTDLIVTSTDSVTSYFGGEVQMAADGSFSYQPPANFTGEDHFEYVARSEADADTSFTAQVNLTVTPVNDRPMTADDLYFTPVGQVLTMDAAGGVLANDRDAETLSLSVTAQNSTYLVLNADGSFAYTPPAGFTGRHSFQYVASDGSRNAGGMLTFVVGGDQVPNVSEDGYLADAGNLLDIAAEQGLLANDNDPENQTLTIVSTGIFDTLFGGEVNIQPDGSFQYVSAPHFDGFDSFTYTVSDGVNQVIGAVVISVTP